MTFNEHSNLKGEHAFLSPSKYYWANYNDDKIAEAYSNFQAIRRGTQLHELAESCISIGQKLPKSSKTMNMYVNDAIGFRMKPEQVLYYSSNCFGTTDAISFRNNVLRIHDLKTGVTPAHMEQLLIYAALFCLQQNVKPKDIETELRLYQNDEILYSNPLAEEIEYFMERIITASKIIDRLKSEEEQS